MYMLEKQKQKMSTYIQKCIDLAQPKIYMIYILFVISDVSFLQLCYTCMHLFWEEVSGDVIWSLSHDSGHQL